MVAGWNFSFMTLNFFFFKLSLFPPVGYPYIPSFQAPELAVKSGQSLRLEGFCFVIPIKCCFLGKFWLVFFFFYIIPFLKIFLVALPGLELLP